MAAQYDARMLKLSFSIVLALALAACGGKKSTSEAEATTPTETAPAGDGTATSTGADGTQPMSPEECMQKGGQVKGDIGDGKVACDEGQEDLGRVRQGIEGAVCCAPGPGGKTTP